jgi:protein phosphatase PTC7
MRRAKPNLKIARAFTTSAPRSFLSSPRFRAVTEATSESNAPIVQTVKGLLPQGTQTLVGSQAPPEASSCDPPFRFETGLGLFAKRSPRPFPPPFLSPPSGSFSEPLSTHNRSRDRRAFVNGELIRGFTNGDDAVYASNNFIGANDGVGAWSTKAGGHAGLWSRLILHFWALEIEQHIAKVQTSGQDYTPTPVEYLQKAYEHTIKATSEPNLWQGTTTAAGAQLHFQRSSEDLNAPATPILYITNIGDSQILVIRPREQKVVFKTTEQWHWFDCPRQLGTNSPDTPELNAVIDKIEIEENDVVLAMSDGVHDNLWEHEIVTSVLNSIQKWEAVGSQSGQSGQVIDSKGRVGGAGGGMHLVAEELMKAAKVIAQDPFAESPFMEHAIDEGLAMEGGELFHGCLRHISDIFYRQTG